ncbi:MAG: DUF308 domain-containing protein [Oscillospiraceae bacterium]|nr:DUF308 domain-containing protein [Oscillospiraceae bacterium]
MSKTKLISLLAAVFVIIIGVALILAPVQSLAGAIRIIGIIFIVLGAVGAVSYLWLGVNSVPVLIISILAVIIGVIFAARPYNMVSLIHVFAGIIIALNGIVNLMGAFNLKSQNTRRWKAAVIMSALAIVLGVIIITKPIAAAATLVRVIGIIVLYNGFTSLMIALKS